MMFQVLGSFAEYERDMIRARVKTAGKHCGRPPLAPELAERIRQAMAVPGRPGIRMIAKQFGVSPMTVQNVAN
jgi:DNA invertase Pin-like site-specific DNA recombinase